MDQRFEGTPQAEIRVEGGRALRGDVSHDWGSQLVWEVRRNGQVLAQVPARANADYQHPDSTPGQYEVVLQMFQYDGCAKDKDGNFTQSKFVEVSNKVGDSVG